MGEECDDGNLISNDGCSRQCQNDVGQPVSMLTPQGSPQAAQASASSLRGTATTTRSSAGSFPSAEQPSTTLHSSRSSIGTTHAGFPSANNLTIPSADGNPSEQVIPFPTTSEPAPVSATYPQQPVYATTSALNDSGPATLSLVAMGTAAGLAWARRRRRD